MAGTGALYHRCGKGHARGPETLELLGEVVLAWEIVAAEESEIPLQENEADSSRYAFGGRGICDPSGVDRSLIRSYLKRTPTECLQALEEMQQLAESARRVDESVS